MVGRRPGRRAGLLSGSSRSTAPIPAHWSSSTRGQRKIRGPYARRTFAAPGATQRAPRYVLPGDAWGGPFMIQRRKVILGTLGVTAGLAAAGCSSPGHAKDGPRSGGPASPSAAPVRLTVTPTSGADRVSPAEPVVVTVDGGKLRS